MNSNEIKALATTTLAGVCEDEDAPAAAKAAAARTLLEAIGVIGKNSTGSELSDKALSELSAQELDAEIRRLQDSMGSKPLKKKA